MNWRFNMSIMKFIWESGHESVEINIDPDNYDEYKIRKHMDEFLRIYLNRTGKSKDVDDEYHSEDDQEEYQRIIEKWKAKDSMTQYAQNYVSSTAFDNRFHPELYGTSDPLYGAVPGTGAVGAYGAPGLYGSRPVEPPPKVIHIDELAKKKVDEPKGFNYKTDPLREIINSSLDKKSDNGEFSISIDPNGPGMSEQDINEILGIKPDINLEEFIPVSSESLFLPVTNCPGLSLMMLLPIITSFPL